MTMATSKRSKVQRFEFDEMDHIYRIDGQIIPSITQILKSSGIADTRYYTPQTAERGTAVHEACQFYDEDDLDMESIAPRKMLSIVVHSNKRPIS